MAKVHVKVNDQVYVLSGKDRGMSGKVLAVFPDKGRIIVEGVNMITRHTKTTLALSDRRYRPSRRDDRRIERNARL